VSRKAPDNSLYNGEAKPLSMRPQPDSGNEKKRFFSFFRSANVPLACLPVYQVGKARIAHSALRCDRNSDSKFRALAQFRSTI